MTEKLTSWRVEMSTSRKKRPRRFLASLVLSKVLASLARSFRLETPHLRQSQPLRIASRISTAFPLRPPRPLRETSASISSIRDEKAMAPRL
jgi:hypothetical protein